MSFFALAEARAQTQYEYDATGNVTAKTDALGHRTDITYDADNDPLTRTDARGGVTQFSYDVSGSGQAEDVPTETISANFEEIKVTYTELNGPTDLFDGWPALEGSGGEDR